LIFSRGPRSRGWQRRLHATGRARSPLTPGGRRGAHPTAYWCPVLHAHLPWVRDPDATGALEEDWLFEALIECYLPLVDVMDRLRDGGVAFQLTLDLSPTLVSMLSDPLLQDRCARRLDALIELARREGARTRRKQPELHPAARHYATELPRLAAVLRERHGGDLLRALRGHRDAGGLELAGCAATHGFLPLLEPVPEAVRAQILVGAQTTGAACGERLRGFWLPECGYAPGFESPLREAGVDYVVIESHGVQLAEPAPPSGLAAPIVSPGGVAFFPRDPISSRQVWSAESGYPGHAEYREFFRDVGWELPPAQVRRVLGGGPRRGVGLKYHAVSGGDDLSAKRPWSPETAAARARTHARHFVEERARQATGLDAGARPPLIVSAFDAELFGHWWFEGPWFLEEVFRELARRGDVEPETPARYLERHPRLAVCEPQRSSWGREGYAAVWLDASNDWLPPRLDAAARRLVALARRRPRARGSVRRALDQAARELLLAQASDWAFMLSTGAAADYGKRRALEHLERFDELARSVETREAGARLAEARLARLEALDPIFPELTYRAYA
jgi:1,4-alpha-glucan branching enzyme